MTPEELAALEEKLADPMWRLCNLYTIMVKGEDGEADLVLPFKPNRAQRRFLARLWSRNIILKARQLGFTTLIAIKATTNAMGIALAMRLTRSWWDDAESRVHRPRYTGR